MTKHRFPPRSTKPAHKRPLTRRQLLYAAGALGGGSLILPSIMGREAAAQASQIKRILIFVSPHQVMPAAMHMRRGNAAGSAFEYSFADVPSSEFSATLAPLAGYKDRLTVVEGLSLTSAMVNSGYTNNHDTAHHNLLTGAGVAPSGSDWDTGKVLGPSVDQVIASTVAHPDRIPSLEFGTSNGYQGGFCSFGEDSKTPISLSPRDAYDRLFSDFQQEEPTEETQIYHRRGSVLDMLDQEYAAVAPKLAGEDREKLENHRALLADLERRMSGLSSLECSAPTSDQEWVGEYAAKRDRARQFGKIVASAFACDMTRVATVQMSQLANEEFDAPPGDVHQDYAHQADKSDTAQSEMRKFNRVYAEMFASIVDEIAAYGDVDGSLLDNTLVVWMSEHGITDKAHTLTEHPAVMVGNLGGHFDVGRYISVPRNQVNPKEDKESVGTAHSHFLVSLMQGMGLTDDHINMPEYTGSNGTVVSLRGPLPELS